METTHKEFKHCDVIAVTGRVDSSTAPKLSAALDKITDNGRFKIVVDMGGLEYMSSAGFRALLSTQRNCKRYNRGEVVLAAVPRQIREALELAGFTELFKTFDDDLAAVGSF
ncbi:MAG: putative anti-sigma factor antagonist BtrV [Anaerolineales bacterium]|nr:putative anti-sigma factor antagonist BtrV [Anaerolineales bacterium]